MRECPISQQKGSCKKKDTFNKNLKSKGKEASKLEIEKNNLKNEITKMKEELVAKDDEVKKNIDEKAGLQEKVESLLDLLYGCNACGLFECECSDSSVREDCDNSLRPQNAMNGDQPSPPPDTSSQTPVPHPPPQPSSTPWTPPPTPPCSSCGGINFGPCPSSVCFDCIPPLERKIEFNTGSLSRTPPGTPPQLRLEQRAARTRPG